MGYDGKSQADFEALGFKFGENVDKLFVAVTFPKGWSKKATDHSMWTDLLDDKGRKRGSIFFKAAFYDQDAFCDLKTRFQVSHNYKGTVEIKDACGLVTKSTRVEEPNWNGDIEKARKLDVTISHVKKDLCSWLDIHYPNWHSPLGHWED